METVFALITMIGMIGMIAGVVSIILVVISTLKKDGLVKKYLKIMGVGFALFIVAVIVTPGNEEVTPGKEKITVHDIIGDNLGNTYFYTSVSEERSSEILAEILGEGTVATSYFFQFNKNNYTRMTFSVNESYVDSETEIYKYYVTPELEKENKEPSNYHTGSTSKDLTVIEGTRYFVETSDDYSSVTRIYGFDEKNILTIDMLFPAVPDNEKYTFEEFSLLVNENIDNLWSISSDSMSKLSLDKGAYLKDGHDFLLENMVVKNAKLEKEEPKKEEPKKEEPKKEEPKKEEPKKEVPKKEEPKKEQISTEYKNALNAAKYYSDRMHMSKRGIYDQLTSEYGENFSADAAQYAVDNLNANYKKNALNNGKVYYEQMSMSKSGVYDQLVSEYGEKFTAEEAQYAVDNLN